VVVAGAGGRSKNPATHEASFHACYSEPQAISSVLQLAPFVTANCGMNSTYRCAIVEDLCEDDKTVCSPVGSFLKFQHTARYCQTVCG
jgi:hypothetical protein